MNAIKISLKRKRTNSEIMVVNDIKISQKLKKQRLLKYRKIYYKMRKR